MQEHQADQAIWLHTHISPPLVNVARNADLYKKKIRRALPGDR
jgi:hypothetical protein